MILDDIRVIDAATLAAGPLVATALGEYGADVIKVEQPGVGDPLRRWGEMRDGIGLVWKSVSRNKRSITLNFRVAEGQALFGRLLERSDVLVLNQRPSTLEKWGLDPRRLCDTFPRLIVLHVTGFGSGGPHSDRPGFGTLAEAMSGFAHIVGESDGPPTLPPFMLADGVASLSATSAVLAALYERDARGGSGQWIDVNLIEPLARLIEASTLTFDQLGWNPGRQGNRWDTSAPRNTFATSDGRWIAMSSAAPTIAQRVFRVIGHSDWAEDDAYVDPVRRRLVAEEIDEAVAAWIAQRTAAEAMEVFEQADVAAAPVYDAEALLGDAHLAARGTFVSFDDPDLGVIRVQAPTARLSATPASIRTLGPSLGAHNEEVFADLLEVDPTELCRLAADGVV